MSVFQPKQFVFEQKRIGVITDIFRMIRFINRKEERYSLTSLLKYLIKYNAENNISHISKNVFALK